MKYIAHESLLAEIAATESRLSAARRRENEAKAIYEAATEDRRRVERLAGVLNDLAVQNRVTGGQAAAERAKGIDGTIAAVEQQVESCERENVAAAADADTAFDAAYAAVAAHADEVADTAAHAAAAAAAHAIYAAFRKALADATAVTKQQAESYGRENAAAIGKPIALTKQQEYERENVAAIERLNKSECTGQLYPEHELRR